MLARHDAQLCMCCAAQTDTDAKLESLEVVGGKQILQQILTFSTSKSLHAGQVPSTPGGGHEARRMRCRGFGAHLQHRAVHEDLAGAA